MLSYGLVLALFLLGPGFASYAGLFFGLRGGRFEAAPPPPNSIFSLAVVGMSSLVWHAMWALVLGLQAAACAAAPCVRLSFNPDVYTAALAATHAGAPPVAEGEVAAFMWTCLLLSLAAFGASAGLARLQVAAELLRQPLYGLYAGLVREAAVSRDGSPAYVTAYVVTDLGEAGSYAGYVGLLENLQVGADKQLAAVSLIDCNSFLLQLGPPLQRTPAQRTQLIDRLVIDGPHVRNIAFEVIRSA